jgi:hypothetical protein
VASAVAAGAQPGAAFCCTVLQLTVSSVLSRLFRRPELGPVWRSVCCWPPAWRLSLPGDEFKVAAASYGCVTWPQQLGCHLHTAMVVKV